MFVILITLSVSVAAVVSTESAAQIFITAPNVFHLGVEETISVILHNVKNPVNVTIAALEYPGKQRNLATTNGIFMSEEPGILKLKLDPDDFPMDGADQDDISTKRYAYLVAETNETELTIDKEVKVLVSYSDGIVLLQTDKPIYTPQQSESLEYTRVKIRIMPLGFDLKPAKNKKVTVVVKNPQGVVVQRWKDLTSETGFITRIFGLSEFALIGNWTILAFHGHKNSENTSVKFEVKEYVLPKFSVSISGPRYVLPDAKVIAISIRASYTYGKAVEGMALIKASMVGKRMRAVLVDEPEAAELKNGRADFFFKIENIKNVSGLAWFPEGRRFQVEVDVIEKTSGKKESAIDNGIYFVKSPFSIQHEPTAEYFKPALPFLVKVDVLYPDKKPARGIPLSISVKGTTFAGNEVDIGKNTLSQHVNINFEDTTNDQGRATFVIDSPGNMKKMKIKVETNKDDIPVEHNTFVDFEVNAYSSPSRTFLYLRAIRDKEHINCDVFVNKNASKITFMVIARGKILYQRIKVHSVGVISSFWFRILPEMSPSSRLVAFFVGQDGEVIADSTLIEINDGLPNKIEFLEDAAVKSGQQSLYPGTTLEIRLTATPGTRIGLLAVDQSVYILRNREKLNKKKVLNLMNSLDLGCGVGPGSDSEDVFFKAGTVVITNADVSSKKRTEFGCPQKEIRKKRSTSTSEDLSKCCKLGFQPARASCVIRARYWFAFFTPSCKKEFLRCCFNATGEKDPTETQARSRKVHQSESTIFEDEEVSQGQIRKYFPEAWLFTEANVGDDGIFHLPANLPDSITTWVIQAAGISNQTGLGVARPLYIRTFKKFFLSLRVPYSVQRGEQISVIATVFNYWELDLKIKISLEEGKEFCTSVPAGEKSAVMLLSVSSNDAASVSFPITPVKLGMLPITVKAVALLPDLSPIMNDVVSSDVVIRSILVVPEGVEQRTTYSFVLDPQGVLRDEKPDTTNSSSPATGLKHDRVVHNDMQIDTVALDVPSRAIPGSIAARMLLTGNFIGPAVTSLISGGLENLLRMPMGCGEQTMMFLAPNVYVLQYLLKTGQVTADIESRAYVLIQSGYQRALNYRREDKSFSAFGESRPGSTWLTAFAARVFCAADKFDGIAMDETLVCDSVSWILENQRRDGAFPEMKDIIHKSMMGGVHGDVAMTAFVLVSLVECGCNRQNKSQRIQNAVSFLETELNSIHKVNILALSTYALALAGSRKGVSANRKLLMSQIYNKENATRHWDVGNKALSVETTAYALLAQMALGRLKFAGPIVTWLTSQRDPQGGFVSTQDTCVALQALSKYSEKTAGAHLDLRVSVSSEKDANWKRRYYIVTANALTLRQEDITRLLGGQIFIDSLGSGVGQLLARHNIPIIKKTMGTCYVQFSLEIKVREERRSQTRCKDSIPIMGRSGGETGKRKETEKAKKCRKTPQPKSCRKKKRKNRKHKRPKHSGKIPDACCVQPKVCARYLKDGKTGMTIMDIGVFSGFLPDKDSLTELMENVKPSVDRFEVSDRSVILYVKEISSDIEFCAKFTVNRIFDVGTVQPVPVKVFDYYKPDDSCTQFYSPDSKSALLAGICEEGYCRCAQDDCPSCIDRSFDPKELVDKVCHDSVDFAVIGEVVMIDERDFRKQSWITYDVKLNEIIKKRKTNLRKGDLMQFKKRSGCVCPEPKERKEYLIMGREEGSFFVFDKTSFVIPWVRKRKSSNLDYIRARVGMDPRCTI
ncbi:LOW QUALITY PROTEIN: venom factor-like [Montipora foliosa]|uniref:LOW QUALITY PROTEIN: venom factor-like n=1 Tax=Montipora foliosa TaxID=591990 RepID=UPI0035F14C3B